MGDRQSRDHSRARDFRIVLLSVRGLLPKARLVFRLIASRLGAGSGSISLPLPGFEAEFELSQGEIAPYAQILADVERGVIPDPATVKGWTILDCGANVGLFSLFLKEAARVVAVEPNPSVCGRLRRNMEHNDVDATVIDAAVSDKDGSVKIDFTGPSVLSGIGSTGSDVRSLCIDSIVAECSIGTIDLLKLDVEGHEIEALEGGAAAFGRGRIRRIVAEFQDAESLAALDNHLLPLGFERAETGSINARYDLAD